MIRLEELIRRMQQNIRIQNNPVLQGAAVKETVCEKCGDTGVVYSGDVAWRCSCRNGGGKRQQAVIPPELQNHNFEGFKIDYYDGVHRERAARALQVARQFVKEYLQSKISQGIMFTGGVGAGKTYLAAAIANDLLDRGAWVQFLVVPEFLDDLRAALLHNAGDFHGPDDVALLDSIRQVEVLILDDLGAHNYTEWTCNKLYSLLNYRLNHQLPVIITSNLSLEELEVYLGERTTSRIVQMCHIYRLTVDRDIRHIIRNRVRNRQDE
jgi:DNA replication protein DnaC